MAEDARLLLVNADDIGIHEGAVDAAVETVDRGLAASGSVMVLGGDRALRLLAAARIEEVDAEFRAQVETALAAGLLPTHLDWHCLLDGGRQDIFECTLAIAEEYGIAVRAWSARGRKRLRRVGRPAQDRPFLDSFAVPLADKHGELERRLRAVPAGLTEWAVHPALPAPIDGGADVRRTDREFLLSARAREVVEQEGITVLGYGDPRVSGYARSPGRARSGTRRPW